MERRNFLSSIGVSCLFSLDLLKLKRNTKITLEQQIIDLVVKSVINQENVIPKIDPTVHNPFYVMVYNHNISGNNFVGGRVIVEFDKNTNPMTFSKSWEINKGYVKKYNINNNQIIFSVASHLRKYSSKFNPNTLIVYELKQHHGLRPFIYIQNDRCVDVYYLCKNGYWYDREFKKIHNFSRYPNDIFKHVINQKVKIV